MRETRNPRAPEQQWISAFFRPWDFGFRTFSPMSHPIQILINGQPATVPPGTVVAAAIAQAGVARFRRSVSGQPRGPLCGMGTCMECRVTINGRTHCRSCQTICTEGMQVQTDD
jgi:predicted molibdopterin-dependent oxidoreductase YjgC